MWRLGVFVSVLLTVNVLRNPRPPSEVKLGVYLAITCPCSTLDTQSRELTMSSSVDQPQCVWDDTCILFFVIWRQGEWKTTLSAPNLDSNLDLPVIGILVSSNSSAFNHATTDAAVEFNTTSALANYATEAGLCQVESLGAGKIWLHLSLIAQAKQLTLKHFVELVYRPESKSPWFRYQQSPLTSLLPFYEQTFSDT
uniref:Uncharacterized protein n=1 Tax=Timema shepardi TaxID=629360 RepID=A0A7R9G0B1_TIMSH|nr:unnamed protein product [Timema shepardi]